MEQLQSHIWQTASSDICAFPHILGSPSSYMTLQLRHSEFPYIWGKFYFISYQCTPLATEAAASRTACSSGSGGRPLRAATGTSTTLPIPKGPIQRPDLASPVGQLRLPGHWPSEVESILSCISNICSLVSPDHKIVFPHVLCVIISYKKYP